MNAGESGIEFVVTSNLDMTGGTATFLCVNPLRVKSTLSATVGTTTFVDPVTSISYAPGFWAYRNVLTTDFPVQGIWMIQLQAIMPDTTLRKADVIQLTVGQSLS